MSQKEKNSTKALTEEPSIKTQPMEMFQMDRPCPGTRLAGLELGGPLSLEEALKSALELIAKQGQPLDTQIILSRANLEQYLDTCRRLGLSVQKS